MKFVVVNDIHLGAETLFKGVNRKLSRLSLSLLRDFVSKVNSDIRPDFVANLGDLVGDIDRDNDLKNMGLVVSALGNIDCPVYNIVGNHEQRNLTESEMKQALGYESLYYSFEKDGYKFVFLHTEDPEESFNEKSTIIIPDVQLKWFESELRNTSKKVIVFSHHSFADQDVTNNFWFSGRINKCLVHNRVEVRKIINSSGKVIACVNAHLHWNNVTIHENIPYITLQSLVENFNSDGIPSASYTACELTTQYLKVHVMGNDRFEFVKYL